MGLFFLDLRKIAQAFYNSRFIKMYAMSERHNILFIALFHWNEAEIRQKCVVSLCFPLSVR